MHRRKCAPRVRSGNASPLRFSMREGIGSVKGSWCRGLACAEVDFAFHLGWPETNWAYTPRLCSYHATEMRETKPIRYAVSIRQVTAALKLSQSLHSLYSATFTPFKEVIVIDNCSLHGSWSRGSILLNCCSKRIVVTYVSVNAYCCPRHTRGPPERDDEHSTNSWL